MTRALPLLLLLPGLALAQPANAPPVDPAPRPGLAPVPDRRFPTLEQATPPDTRLRPVVPTAPVPTRGASFADRDSAHFAERACCNAGRSGANVFAVH